MKNSVAPPPPHSCTLPITGPLTTLLLMLVLDDVEWHAYIGERRPKCSMDFSLIACLQVVQPLLTEAQGLPFVAAAGLHGAAARACFCCCWLLLHRNDPLFTPSLYPLQFLFFKCVLQALEGLEGPRNVLQRLHCNWQMTSESPFKNTAPRALHTLPPPGFTLLFAALDVLEDIIRCWGLHCRAECHR